MLWIVNACFLLLLHNQVEENSNIIIYTLISCFILIFNLFQCKLADYKTENDFPINKFVFIIGCILIAFTTPLFENDQFRYLWEGKVLWHGYNPYLDAPNTISDVFFSQQTNIAFPQLTSIYPPLSLVFLSFFGLFSFGLGLTLLQLVNGVMVWLLLKKLWTLKGNNFALIILTPFLQKEFIQSVHLDLLAILLFTLVLFKTDSGQITLVKNRMQQSTGILLSFYAKIIPIISYPFFYLSERRSKTRNLQFIIISALAALLPLAYFLFLARAGSGINTFNTIWVWTPGLYGVLTRLFLIDAQYARILCLLIFILCYIAMLIIQKKKNLPVKQSLLIVMSTLMFCSPVANPWYFVFLLPFAWIGTNPFALLYIAISFVSYIPHVNMQYAWLTELVIHSFYPLIVYYQFKRQV